MNRHERAYLRLIMRKRDEYMAARDEEFIVPERPIRLSDDARIAAILFVNALHNKYRHEWRNA